MENLLCAVLENFEYLAAPLSTQLNVVETAVPFLILFNYSMKLISVVDHC